MIKQNKFLKEREIEVTVTIPKSIVQQIDEYIDLAGIEHWVVRAGEVKYTQDAKREFFILECIKQILERDAEEVKTLKARLEDNEKIVEYKSEVGSLVKNILGDDIAELASVLEEEIL